MMLIQGLFAQAVFGLTFEHSRSGNANGWDGSFNYAPGSNRVLSGMKSWHDNYKEDRIYQFYYTSKSGMSCSPDSWTAYQNEWDGTLNFACPSGQAIAGVSSYHNNDKQDRRFRFKCCSITSGGKFKIVQVDTTAFLNSWDAVVDAKCNSNSVLVGLYSYHDNGTEDRRWKLKCGSVDEVNVVPESRFVVLRGQSITGFLNGWDAAFSYTAPANTAINGLYSYHDNDTEDRRWRVRYVSMDGVQCSPGGWTAYQNEWDRNLDFTCPTNQVLAGFGSYHDNDTEDRRYQFRCCSVASSGFFVTGTRYTGWGNDMDGVLDTQCGRGEMMVGLNSYHDNDKEDRRFRLRCAQVKQNAPDYDDCEAVDVVDAQVGQPQLGSGKINTVNHYTTDFQACGNPNVGESGILTIEKTQELSNTESLELSESMEESFSFSETKEFHFSMGTSITADPDGFLGSNEITTSFEMGWKTGITSTKGFTMGSSSTKKSETTTVEVNVMSSTQEFKPVPYQWRRVRATYVSRTVSIPVKLKLQCKRKDGDYKYKWVDSVFKNGGYSHVTVEYQDKTDECPQSYYKKCECATGLLSEFNTVDGCSVHPFMSAQKGCYVYKKHGCGNGQGLGVSTPRPTVDICDDPARCPMAKHYWDYPLDPTVWEWSHVPCGGSQFPDDEPIEDMMTKLTLKHCYQTRLSTTGYSTRNAAVQACAAENDASKDSCLGVYDPSCDNTGSFYLCANQPLRTSSSSCVYDMINGRRREEVFNHLLAPPSTLRRADDEGEDFAGDDSEEDFGGDEFDEYEL